MAYCASFTWKSILEPRHILSKGCSWRVGNGTSISIWADNWLNHATHRRIMIPKPTEAHLQLVSDLIDFDQRKWNRQLIWDNFIVVDIPHILGVPLCSRTINDTLMWPHTRDCNFTVRSGYH